MCIRDSPYVLYGMAYEGGNKNKEALDYLLNTSVTRGYTDDALFYIREAKKQYGNNDKGILYKEYMLYRQMNEDDLAYSTLKKMYEMYPDDYDLSLIHISLLSLLITEYPQISFSIKMRLGWEDPKECLKLAPIINAKLKTIHGNFNVITSASMFGMTADNLSYSTIESIYGDLSITAKQCHVFKTQYMPGPSAMD